MASSPPSRVLGDERDMLTSGPFSGSSHRILRTEPRCKAAHSATHNATHNKDDLHVPRRTYAAVRDLQVVECIR
jgi:hypothetical protein